MHFPRMMHLLINFYRERIIYLIWHVQCFLLTPMDLSSSQAPADGRSAIKSSLIDCHSVRMTTSWRESPRLSMDRIILKDASSWWNEHCEVGWGVSSCCVVGYCRGICLLPGGREYGCATKRCSWFKRCSWHILGVFRCGMEAKRLLNYL